MPALNFKHLRYYWMVAKTGSIARAAEQLFLTPHAISGQLNEFEQSLGVELFRKVGRNLELTDAGRRILSYADTIFTTGEELLEVLNDQRATHKRAFRVGISDAVSKSIAYRLLEPALSLDEPLKLVCREGRLSPLLAELALHHLDMIVADRPMPTNLNVRGYNHLLGECGLAIFGTAPLARQYGKRFPESLNGAPLLIPGEDVAIQPKLLNWLEQRHVRANIVGEFDDGALMKAFGQAGAGLFVAPSAMQKDICNQYKVNVIGEIDEVTEQVYVITTERRLTDPAVVAISKIAKQDIFGTGEAA
jgi:LysR family transcriptional regulator, transcriptional activator of nhaA